MILVPSPGASDVLPIVDAHSQFDEDTPVAQVIQYAAKGRRDAGPAVPWRRPGALARIALRLNGLPVQHRLF
jgi:hypothetical protein